MTNEEIVAKIKSKSNYVDYMQMLYEQNLPLIRKMCGRYSAYESMDDLLQEAYLGLWNAVEHYEGYNEVKFMTYAEWWIRQAVYRYVQNYGSCLRVPIDVQQKILRYKKYVYDYEKENGKTPSEEEIANAINISVKKVRELQCYSLPLASLDAPIGEECLSTLCEFIEADTNIENETVDKMIDEEAKNALLQMIEKHTTDREQHIIEEYYFNNKNLPQIAEEEGLSRQAIAEIKKNAIQKLRKYRKKLAERIERTDCGLYKHNGVDRFNRTFTSTVEEVALEHLEAQRKYQKWMESTSGKTAEQIKQYMDVMQMDFDRRMQYLYEYG